MLTRDANLRLAPPQWRRPALLVGGSAGFHTPLPIPDLVDAAKQGNAGLSCTLSGRRFKTWTIEDC
jgi:hypothetical protein